MSVERVGAFRWAPAREVQRMTEPVSTHPPTQRPPDRFGFRFAGPVGRMSRLIVGRDERAYVEVVDATLTARFGPWRITTELANIAGVSLTGPYRWWKVAGPPHVSFSDGGLTFATNDERGVCIRFFDPVPGIEPTGRLRHPGLTVTVAEPERLMAALTARDDD